MVTPAPPIPAPAEAADPLAPLILALVRMAKRRQLAATQPPKA